MNIIKNLLKVVWMIGAILVLVYIQHIDGLSFILGELFGMVLLIIDKLSDKGKKKKINGEI